MLLAHGRVAPRRNLRQERRHSYTNFAPQAHHVVKIWVSEFWDDVEERREERGWLTVLAKHALPGYVGHTDHEPRDLHAATPINTFPHLSRVPVRFGRTFL